MSVCQLTENTSVLNNQQLNLLQQLTAQLNPIQQAWVSGYLAASSQLSSTNLADLSSTQPPTEAQATLTIIYGSQTGNAKAVAQQTHQAAEQLGFTTRLINAANYKPKQLSTETHLIVIISTHGEGDPPEDAETLHQYLFSKKAPALNSLKFAVLALGDSSYEFFCKTGIDFDEQLAKLGATRLFERLDCDVDHQAASQDWSQKVLQRLAPELKAPSPQPADQIIAINAPQAATNQTTTYSKQDPYAATLSCCQKITGRDSEKDVRHIEIDLADANFHYQPGDSLGIWFNNDPKIVSEILDLLAIEADTELTFEEQNVSISQLLTCKLELTQLHPGFVKGYAKLTKHHQLQSIAEDNTQLRSYLAERQVIDVIREYPQSITASDLVSVLRKITPRLYSIASAQAEVEQEVHITVGVVDYQAFGERHLGGASGFLAHRLETDATVNIYVQPNPNFRLPADPDQSIIMIGPGTGIAPFRAFLQQRDQQQASGKNWLFFGNPHFTQDFLYQTELQDFHRRGVLTQLDVAFSRDQSTKVYVQDRLLAHGAQLFEWLQTGAHLYVCGDANRMAKDVHQALLTIIAEHGKLTTEQASAYLQQLRTDRRYQKDVY